VVYYCGDPKALTTPLPSKRNRIYRRYFPIVTFPASRVSLHGFTFKFMLVELQQIVALHRSRNIYYTRGIFTFMFPRAERSALSCCILCSTRCKAHYDGLTLPAKQAGSSRRLLTSGLYWRYVAQCLLSAVLYVSGTGTTGVMGEGNMFLCWGPSEETRSRSLD
jgi:hypothetical protein